MQDTNQKETVFLYDRNIIKERRCFYDMIYETGKLPDLRIFS